MNSHYFRILLFLQLRVQWFNCSGSVTVCTSFCLCFIEKRLKWPLKQIDCLSDDSQSIPIIENLCGRSSKTSFKSFKKSLK
jgi:hypothetical protein